jgi:hypothetical protein
VSSLFPKHREHLLTRPASRDTLSPKTAEGCGSVSACYDFSVFPKKASMRAQASVAASSR